jgi:CelD/BcsL family acetyltransferase involved in cellulose biosynthesis
MSSLKVELIADLSRFEALGTEWNALVGRMELPEIFYRWEWNFHYFRRFRTDDALFVVTVRDGAGQLIGIAPLCIRRLKRLGCPVRVVETLLVNLGDYRNFLVDRAHHRGAIVDAILDLLHSRQSSWDVIDLAQFCSREPTTFHVLEAASRCSAWTVRSQILTAVAIRPLDGRVGENAGRLRRIRNRRRALQDRGFEISIGSDRLDEFWADFVALHRKAWPSSPFHEERGRLFYDDLRNSPALKEKLEFSYIALAGRPVAMHFGFVDQHKVYFYMPVMDRDFHKDQVGAVLLYAQLEYYQGKYESFDFLRGLEAYKTWYTDGLAANFRIVISRNSSLSAFMYNVTEVARRFIVELGLPKAIVGYLRGLGRRSRQPSRKQQDT